MSTAVNFEVYIYDNTRGWLLQSRYPGDERAQAIEEAKMLEFTLNRPVRVLRETYFPGSNASEEIVAYVGRLKPKPITQPTLKQGVGAVGYGFRDAPFSERDILDAYPGSNGRKKAKATADFAFRLIVVMIASLLIAILSTGLLSMLSGRLFASLGVTHSTQSLMMFLIFLGLFLLSAIPLVMMYVPLDVLTSQSSPSVSPPAPRPPEPVPKDAPTAKAATTPEAQIEAAVASQAEDDLPPPPAVPDAEPEATPSEVAPEMDQDHPTPAEEADEETESPRLERSRLTMMKFLGGAVSAIKTVRQHLDTYNRFGINLYLAGACGALAEARQLTDQDRRRLIREAVEVIGTRSEQAQQLVERLEGYRGQARYRHMIAAGKVAMEIHLSGSSDPFIAIGGLIKDWNTPQSQQVASTTVTILFTDMVGSTDMTATLGDAVVQDIIRAHNHIVRGTLADQHGKEVKHTGDGIMASFDNAADAVAAAVEIQRKAADHTAKWPRLPLNLRIGMNTGEPIVEENDYFGATVQVAARVCAAAGAGQVWLSEDTHHALPPTEWDAFEHGQQHLKGIQGETRLFEIPCTEARREELVAQAVSATASASEATADDTMPTDAAPADGAVSDSAVEGAAAPAQANTAPPAAQGGPSGASRTPPAGAVRAAAQAADQGKPAPLPSGAPQATPSRTARPKPNLANLPPPPKPRKPRPKQKPLSGQS